MRADVANAATALVSVVIALAGCSSNTSTPIPSADDAAVIDAGGIADASSDQGGDAASPPGRLAVAGAHLLDPDGKEIILRGYNWGAWGTMQPSDATDNVAQGANSVRIPLRWWGQWKENVDSRDDPSPGHIDPAHLAILDDMIHHASKARLWITLFVDSNNGQGADGYVDNFWANADAKAKFIEVWEFLVRRYLNEPYVGAWEILPEPRPTGVSDDAVREFYDSVIPHIRAIDPRTPIVVGPNAAYNATHLEAAYTKSDPRLIYTANYFIFAHPLAHLPSFTTFRKAHDVPVWVNQVGVESGDKDAEVNANQVLGALNDEGLGWAWWTYRINSTNDQVHGIFYLDSSGTSWKIKQNWFDLVGTHLK